MSAPALSQLQLLMSSLVGGHSRSRPPSLAFREKALSIVLRQPAETWMVRWIHTLPTRSVTMHHAAAKAVCMRSRRA